VPDERIALAPHAVDVTRFSDPHGAYDERVVQWRKKLGISPDSRAVLFAGKLVAKKDPLLLLEAYLESGATGHLIFVGDGVQEGEIRARAQGRPDVHFLPFQNQQAMPAVYRLGEVFVLPSRGPGETWGLALNEAMACHRPVIASSKVGGARDLVVQGLTGWQFEAGNRQQLTSALRTALTCERYVLRDMGVAARREIAHWSVEVAAEGIERAVMGFAAGSAVTSL
jgi:glycosyltransferase involved in cell wall biosynthesis